MTPNERDAFEAWLRDVATSEPNWESREATWAWRAWQARAVSPAAPQVSEPTDTVTFDGRQWMRFYGQVRAAIEKGQVFQSFIDEWEALKRVVTPSPQPAEPRNFCPSCGKRTPPDSIHTCSPQVV